MRRLPALIRSEGPDLLRELVGAASAAGLHKGMPQLEAAWRRAFQCFLVPLQRACEDPSVLHRPADGTWATDHPLTAAAVDAARRHRADGVTTTTFLTLLKLFRDRVQALADRHFGGTPDHVPTRDLVQAVTDAIELAVIADAEDTADDLATLRAANRRAVAERLKYLTIFESLPTPALMLDAHGRIEHANAMAMRRFGDEAVPGGGYYDARVPALLDGRASDLVDAAAEDRPLTLDTGVGPRRFQVTSCELLALTETSAGRLLLLNDVTELLEELARATAVDRARTAFVATMSHELRTPLNAMLGGLDLLVQKAPDASRLPAVEAIRKAAAMLTQRVDEVLEHGRLERGAVPLRLAPLLLGETIGSAIDIVAPAARRKGLALVADTGAVDDLQVSTDCSKLQRILVNLLDNAVKFTDRGAVVLRARRRCGTGDIEIEVEDTGCGFEPAVAALLFEPYVQVPSNADDVSSHGGTGLGLAISRRLAEALGGRIEAESVPTVGSRFRLIVPVRATILPSSPLGRILLVDDDEPSRIVAAGLLGEAGGTVDGAASAAEAWRRVAVERPDAVVLDLRLPDTDGVSLARQLRRRWPSLPLLALTAAGGSRATGNALAAGVDRVLRKPDDLGELTAAVGAAMAALRSKVAGTLPQVDRCRLDKHIAAMGRGAVTDALDALRTSAHGVAVLLRRLEIDQPAPRLMEAIRGRLHALAGGAAQIGLTALAGRCRGLEIVAMADDTESLIAERDTFERDIDEAMTALGRQLVEPLRVAP